MSKDIPITIVDQFFQDPSLIVKAAHKLEYYKPSDGAYYGERTANLWEVDRVLASYIITQVLQLIVKVTNKEAVKVDSEIRFQRMPASKEGFDKGWVHDDGGLATALIYLQEDPDINAGTSFFTPVVDEVDMTASLFKHKFYSMGVTEGYEKIFNKHQNQFVETIKVSNVFNRCLLFGESQLHAGNYSITHDRLFLLVRIKGILTDNDNLPNIIDMRNWEVNALDNLKVKYQDTGNG